ncbi:uncharacterized protein LOC133779035 [Humulus lupulus]|uniref:uncharacterized protein LOC133779035 n=1 Tax=Humulus lupulus TaxID=3486 RepID=UPI002B40DAAC|nr:uncharacterized protein LOC133779035 [Humulus lupulus]
MEKYYKRVSNVSHFPEVEVDNSKRQKVSIISHFREVDFDNSNRNCTSSSIDMTNLPTDLGLRPPISNYHPNIQDEIRRHYLQQGPCQPRSREFPKKFYRVKERRFNIAWFDQFSTWLECSISKNSAFFLCCYLFKSSIGKQAGGNTFVSNGLAFRGHDESQESNNQCNFLELLTFLADHNEEVRAVALKNAHENLKLTSPKIQKDIVNACAMETINVIIRDMGDVIFSILVYESRDVSIKEQMVVMFRYVDKRGCVIELFINIEHVHNTTAISLKI